MNVEEAIKTRRSIRKYRQKAVPEEFILKVIEAGRLAPSGNNAQPARYIIIESEKVKQELKENKIFKQAFVYTAPALIVCCGDSESYPKSKIDPGLDDPFPIRAVRDVAIAAENMVLQATELGLGTCYIGWTDKPKIKNLLNIPDDYVVPFVITLGYPDEKPSETSRKKMGDILKRV